MPTASLLIDPSDPNLKQKVQNLAPTPGYCIFVDIVGSTQMKQQGLLAWIAYVHNAFANAAAFLNSFRPLKGIGDEVMYYIEAVDLQASGDTPLQVFDSLWQVATKQKGGAIPDVKIVPAKCDDVYPISFWPNAPDYYGADIDLTARLKSEVQSNQIVIDGRFRDEVIAIYNGIGNKAQFVSVSQLGAEETKTFKGFQNPTRFFRA